MPANVQIMVAHQVTLAKVDLINRKSIYKFRIKSQINQQIFAAPHLHKLLHSPSERLKEDPLMEAQEVLSKDSQVTPINALDMLVHQVMPVKAHQSPLDPNILIKFLN